MKFSGVAAVCRVRCTAVILIEAPSSAYHVVGWGWEPRPQERRRPHALLHHTTQILLRDRPARPHHVPLRPEPGRRGPTSPAYASGTGTIAEGHCPLPGGSRRLRGMPLHLVLAGGPLCLRGHSLRPG